MAKWVYGFGGGKAEGKADMKNLLGGKGANLAEMANLGLPVPPGFTITTEVCTHFYANSETYPKELLSQVDEALADIGTAAAKTFGDGTNPLLVSVRSGARASMPGMMDTVLNLGLNDNTVEALAKKSGDPRFAFDSYRRFICSRIFWPSIRTPKAIRSIPSSRPTIGRLWSASIRRAWRRRVASLFRRTRASSFGARSVRYLAHG